MQRLTGELNHPATSQRSAAEVRAESMFVECVRGHFDGNAVVALDSVLSFLSRLAAQPALNVRNLIVSGQWGTPESMLALGERLFKAAPLGMFLGLEVMLAQILDNAACAAAVQLAHLLGEDTRRRADPTDEKDLLARVGSASIPSILAKIDACRSVARKDQLSKQFAEIDVPALMTKWSRRLIRLAGTFRHIQVWSLVDYLESYRSADFGLCVVAGLFSLWWRSVDQLSEHGVTLRRCVQAAVDDEKVDVLDTAVSDSESSSSGGGLGAFDGLTEIMSDSVFAAGGREDYGAADEFGEDADGDFPMSGEDDHGDSQMRGNVPSGVQSGAVRARGAADEPARVSSTSHTGNAVADVVDDDKADFTRALGYWANTSKFKFRTPVAVLEKLLKLIGVLSEMRACQIESIFKTPCCAKLVGDAAELLTARFAAWSGTGRGETEITEGRCADIEHPLDRNAKSFLTVTPPLFTMRLVGPSTRRMDLRDAVIGFVVLPYNYKFRDRAFGATRVHVAQLFDENVLFDHCSGKAAKKFPDSVNWLQTAYSKIQLETMCKSEVFVRVKDGDIPLSGGVATRELMKVWRKRPSARTDVQSQKKARMVTVMPVVTVAAATLNTSVFRNITAAQMALCECAANFETCLMAVSEKGPAFKDWNGVVRQPRSPDTIDETTALIARETVQSYRAHPFSYFCALMQMGETLGFGDSIKCMLATCVCVADSSGAASAGVASETWSKEKIDFDVWRDNALCRARAVSDSHAHTLTACVANKTQVNDLKLATAAQRHEWQPGMPPEVVLATMSTMPDPVLGGGAFSGRLALRRKLAWTLKWIDGEYAAEKYFDGDWFNCAFCPPSTHADSSLSMPLERMWYAATGVRVFRGGKTEAIEDSWEACMHLSTPHRPVVGIDELKQVVDALSSVYKAHKEAAYIGLKREESVPDSGVEVTEFGSQVRFEVAATPEMRQRVLPLAFKLKWALAIPEWTVWVKGDKI